MSANKPYLSNSGILRPIKTFLQLSPFFFILLIGPALAFISLIWWVFVALPCSYLFRDFGKFTNRNDAWVDENFTELPPRSSIVATVTLDGPLTLYKLRQLFLENVILARHPDKNQLFYPEFQQFLTNFMGCRIWKNDPNFQIANHIVEENIQEYVSKTGSHKSVYDILQHNMQNRLYRKNQSPWEVVLVQNAITDSKDRQLKSLVTFRFHHILGDGRSAWAVFIESLGQKPMKTPKIRFPQWTIQGRVLFYLSYFPNFFLHLFKALCHMTQSHTHPFKVQNYRADHRSGVVVSVSPQLDLNEVKQIAKLNGVSVSSVIMCICAGAVRTCEMQGIADRDLTMAWPMPTEYHSPGLSNEMYMTTLLLPTSVACPLTRLKRCHSTFVGARQAGVGKLFEIYKAVHGLLLHRWASLMTMNHAIPFGITNVAGDQEGIHIGSVPCSDILSSGGTLQGCMGAGFTVVSYKGKLRIAAIGRESVISTRHAEKLARDCAYELETLLQISKERYEHSFGVYHNAPYVDSSKVRRKKAKKVDN